LTILGKRRLLRQGVKSAGGFTRQSSLAGKNQKLSESRAQARSSSFDLALLQSRFQRDPQNDRRREQKAFKPLQDYLKLFLRHDTSMFLIEKSGLILFETFIKCLARYSQAEGGNGLVAV
jgi:hypothetical protein